MSEYFDFGYDAFEEPEAVYQYGEQFRLRDYQHECISSVMDVLSRSKSALVVMATGLGKTVVFGHVAADWPTGRVLIVAHRDELIQQAADKVGRITGVPCDIEKGFQRADQCSVQNRRKVVVTSVQTMSKPKRMERFDPSEFGIVIIDEAHHAVADTYMRVIAHFTRNTNCKLLGVTATPDRTDEEALGLVFQEVAYEKDILSGIHDGWLVPVQQQLVWVDGLDFSACRTTAGDLNQGDLATIMEQEKTLHGVVYPIIDIAKDRKTLVFTASVFQAERMAEICNRHMQGSAKSVSGKTPIEDRRELLKAYNRGDFQFLFNCDVATEGFDEPGIQVVAIAKPTKSRAKYAQMIGRGTRPVNMAINEMTGDQERREAIQQSAKPNVLVLDFVGNSGRHKLIHATDILGVEYDDSQLEDAFNEILERSKAGEPTDVEESFRMAEERRQAARRQREIEQAENLKRHQEEILRYEDEQRRKHIVGIAHYGSKVVDAFDKLDIAPGREPGWHKGRKPSLKMLGLLRQHFGFDEAALEKISFFHANQLLKDLFDRWSNNLCSPKQGQLLKKYGYDPRMSRDQATYTINAIKAAGWKRPA